MITASDASPRGGDFLSKPARPIFIPEDFDGDERLMIEAAEEFCRNEVLPIRERLEKQEDGLMPRLIAQAGELGLCGVDSPEAHGGLGLPKNLAARILEMMSLDASFSVTYGITSGISQVGLALFGTDEQKAAFLPALASGREIGAYALSEPNSGSDALSATTRAIRQGDEWVLDGTKMWISNAKWAGQFLTLAKVDGERFTAFIVPRDAPGVSVSREEHKMGLKGSSTARLVLEAARIPVGNLLHEEGKGHQVAFNALNIGRFKLASMSLGPARDALALGTAYAAERRQFGRPISAFPAIQEKIAHAAAKFFAVESAIYRTGALVDAAFDANPAWTSAEEYAIECSAIKVMATEVEAEIVDEMLQIYGGYGFTEEFPIARHYRDARVSRIYEGTNEINRLFLGDRLLRRIRAGTISPPAATGDEFADPAAAAVLAALEHDGPLEGLRLAALSDLLMVAYVAGSARLRAARLGGPASDLLAIAERWLRLRRTDAEARFGLGPNADGHAAARVADLATAVHDARGPIRWERAEPIRA